MTTAQFAEYSGSHGILVFVSALANLNQARRPRETPRAAVVSGSWYRNASTRPFARGTGGRKGWS